MSYAVAAAALATGLCFTDVPHPNPQPPLPRDGSVVRLAKPGPELDAYKAWYDHWRKTQFVRQWHECPPRPGGCLISLPPPDVSVPPTRLHRPVDGRESVTIPEPWVFSVLVLPAALLIGASLPRPAESERSTQA